MGTANQSDVWQTRLIAVPPDSSPILSIIIVTHNSEKHLRRVLASIPPAARHISYELIVFDNRSTDHTKEIVHAWSGARIIEHTQNIGFAAAVNQAAAHACGEWLFLVNPDLILDQGMLPILLEHAKAKDGKGLFVPRLRTPDGTFQPNCRKFPTPMNLLGSRGSLLNRMFGLDQQSYTMTDYTEPTQVPAVAGTALLMMRTFFHEIGEMDARFFLYMEDTDLSVRSHHASGTNWFIPESGAVHHWQEGSRTGKLTREYWHHRTLILYFRKHHPGIGSDLLYPIVIWTHFVMVALLSAFGVKRKISSEVRST